MRITPFQQQAILNAAKLCFGQDAQVWLFGSRVDENKRGGDIDLFIRPPLDRAYSAIELFTLKIQFLGYLEQALGERKIDVVIANSTSSQTIERIAETTGVKL